MPEQVIMDTLLSIQETLSDTSNYRIVNTDANSLYYRRASFIYSRDENYLYISLQIPVSSFTIDFVAYHVTSYPMTIHDNTSHVIQLSVRSCRGIAISQDKMFYFELNEHELSEINTKLHSHERRVFRKTLDNTCIMSIFDDDKAGVRKT